MLRPYQQEAVDAALAWVRRCLDPAVIEAPTGSGKSHIIAGIAHGIQKMSGKKILVIAPSGELVDQDYAKYRALGEPASIYSASLGRKEMSADVVFGSPLTVSNSLRKFGHQFSAVIIDEAHGITPTLRRIVEHMRSQNPKLRVIGLSATPYRLGEGYIYGHHYQHGLVDECLENPFFHSLIYTIDARELIANGYLTQPVIGEHDEHYDTSGLEKTRMGTWDTSSVDRAFVGHGRLTADIVADVIDKSAYRRGVMFFAATVAHAREILESLPPGLSKLVTGETPKAERAQILDEFKSMQLKYLVNVSVLTTGFDAPHVDVIAILRATESAALLQQIIGRGLRIADDKKNCLILDYAENMERHFPHGDIFAPEIRCRRSGGSDGMEAECPSCHAVNLFSSRPNPDRYEVSKYGYFLDLAGQDIMTESGQPIPAHFGRRCGGQTLRAGKHERCEYRWSLKICPSCEHENDIAARYCEACRAEIVDPNEKLREIESRMASDPYRTQIADVLNWSFARWPGRDGKPDTLKITYEISAHPWKISEWQAVEHDNHWLREKWRDFSRQAWSGDVAHDIDSALDGFNDAKKPSRIAFKRKQASKFYEVTGRDWET
jgi:DNA repair protein RadD